MNIEEIREYCLAKPAITEGFPFGEDVLVFKVMNKMFALTGLSDDPPNLNLKCDSAVGGPSICVHNMSLSRPGTFFPVCDIKGIETVHPAPFLFFQE